jgi:hypothetical protein
MRLTPVAMVLALGACEPMDAEDGSDGKADDLTDVDFTIVPGTVKWIAVGETSVAPFLDVWGSLPVISTDDLRFSNPDGARLQARIAPESKSPNVTFAFRLDIAPKGTAQWTTLVPDPEQLPDTAPGTAPWYWDSVTVDPLFDQPGYLRVHGRAIRSTDSDDGIDDIEEVADVEANIPADSDLRFLMIPIWDFVDWEWGEGKYDVALSLKASQP